LSQRYAAVWRAKYVDELSVAELAASWDQTPKAVESLLPRARLDGSDAPSLLPAKAETAAA